MYCPLKLSVAAVGFALLGFAFPAFSTESSPHNAALSTSELISMVVGNTIRYQNDSKDVVNEFLSPDGTIHGSSKKGGKYTNAWEIRFGNYLGIIGHDATDSGCVRVLIAGDKISFRLDIGETEGPFELRLGNVENL